jgi:hypothetical protein
VIRKAGLGDGLSENSRPEMGLKEYRPVAPLVWILGIWESRSREGEPRAAAEEQRGRATSGGGGAERGSVGAGE